MIARVRRSIKGKTLCYRIPSMHVLVLVEVFFIFNYYYYLYTPYKLRER